MRQRKVFEAIVTGIASVILLALFSGCVANSESDSETVEVVESEQEYESSDSMDDSIDVKMVAVEPFSDELAWVCYEQETEEGEESWMGFIDKEGVLKFRYSSSKIDFASAQIYGGDSFEDGVAYIQDGSNCFVIDTSGSVLGYYENTVAYGDRYVVTSTYNDGFSSTSYDYELLSAEGDTVYAFTVEGDDQKTSYYCGGGCFAFGVGEGSSFRPEFFYFVDSGATVEATLDLEGIPEFDETSEKYLIGFSDTEVYLMTQEGVVETIDTGLTKEGDTGDVDRAWIVDASLSDGICAFSAIEFLPSMGSSEYLDSLYSLDIVTGEIYKLSEQYVDAVDEGMSGISVVPFCDGRCVLELEGADGDTYVGIFDSSWSLIGEPFKASKMTMDDTYVDERILINVDGNSNSGVYDINGNCLFEVPCSSSYTSEFISEGLLCYVSSGDIVCLDIDGNTVFDSISNLDAPVVSLE